jgi:uridine kinase
MPQQSYLIGIAGPSGAGKSYLAERLAERLKAPVLALDHYYRDLSHLLPAERATSNFDEPAALEHELLIAQVNELRQGRSIDVPTYDFSAHTRRSVAQPIQPSPFVVLEGLFTLYWPELRRFLGTAVYVDLDQGACLQRRLQRDVQERGRTPDSVIEQFRSTVMPMAERYVLPTMQHADVVVSGLTSIDESVARVLAHVRQNYELNDVTSTEELLSRGPAPTR